MKNQMTPAKLKERLAALREGHNITQREVAEEIGVSQSTISEFENRQDSRLSIFIRYANALGYRLHFSLEKEIKRSNE